MVRTLAVALVAASLLAGTLLVLAEQRIVVRKDGSRLVGEVTETPDGYQIKMAAGTVIIPKSDVVRVETLISVQDQFGQRLAKIDQDDPDQLYELATWAAENELLEEARELLRKALTVKPDHENARLRLRLVEIRLARATQPAVEPTSRDTTAPPPRETVDLSKMLSEEDVYRIRLMELKANDSVVIEFRNRVLERFIESMRGIDIFKDEDGERRFRTAPKVHQARYILENTDRDTASVRDDILVKTEPIVMRDFKMRIWPTLAQTCASPSCHGGVNGAGGLKLYNIAMSDPRVYYTNFYILQGWSKGGNQLVNRQNRDMSLLLQYGLPPKLATRPHPKAIDPVFPTRDDRNYRVIEEWIALLRWPLLPPGYRVKYAIPGQPETPPTTSQSVLP